MRYTRRIAHKDIYRASEFFGEISALSRLPLLPARLPVFFWSSFFKVVLARDHTLTIINPGWLPEAAKEDEVIF